MILFISRGNNIVFLHRGGTCEVSPRGYRTYSALAWGGSDRFYLVVIVGTYLIFYADLIWLLRDKTEACLATSQPVLWMTHVGTLLGPTETTTKIFFIC